MPYKPARRKIKPGDIISTLPRFSKYNIPELDESHPHMPDLSVPVEQPDRSEEQKAQRRELVDGIRLLHQGAILFLRHKKKTKSDSGLTISTESGDQRIGQTWTGTVVKTNPMYEKSLRLTLEGYPEAIINQYILKPGDVIRFSYHAPFAFFEEFPEIQLIDYHDVIAALNQLPPGVVED